MQNASSKLTESVKSNNVGSATRESQKDNLKLIGPDIDRDNEIAESLLKGLPNAIGTLVKPGGPGIPATPPGIMTPAEKRKHQQELDKNFGHKIPLNHQAPNSAFNISAHQGVDYKARVARQAQAVAEHNKQEKANMTKDVKLKIEVVAPPGFGVNTSTPDRNVDIAKAINASTYSGGPYG